MHEHDASTNISVSDVTRNLHARRQGKTIGKGNIKFITGVSNPISQVKFIIAARVKSPV